MVGRTISHYQILDKLGEGGMSVVYLAQDTKLERKVAIKFLPRHISADPEEKERLNVEAKAAAALNHPNIATIYSIEEADDEIFIVMEYIDGKELKELIHTGPAPSIPVNDAIGYSKQIAEGLAAAHKKGIIHRDIKSSNIMITEDGIVKIMDFGLAKMKGGAQLTKVGSTVGTTAYMSPEQARGEEVDYRADIWSFGVVIYEMLTGKLPFRGDYDQAIIYKILNEEPESAAGIEGRLQHIISKCLAKKADDRYQSPAEIADELATIARGEPVKKLSKLPWAIAGGAVIILAVALYFFLPTSKTVKATEEIKTIAVLPFDDLSPNKNQGYFSDGLTDELINTLAKNPKLRVTAHTSSFSFKGKGLDIRTIAARLNVSNILEGSVQKAGNMLRVSADLVNVRTDATLWSSTYDGTMNNIFTLQDSISGAVAAALNVALLGNKKSAPEQKTDPKAYNDYLLGEHFFNLGGRENFELAGKYFKKASSIDSDYAPAWVGLSTVHEAQAEQGYVSTDKGSILAQEEVRRALEVDPNLSSAYAQMARIKMVYEWDWNGADRYFKKALQLEPGNAVAIGSEALLKAMLGRFSEAISLLHRSIEIDPLRTADYLDLGAFTWCAGSLDVSITYLRKCLEINPQFPMAHLCIGLDYLEKGRLDSALANMMKESEPTWQMQGLAIVYYALGRKEKANHVLAEYIRRFQESGAFQIAEIYAFRNEKDEAFQWLNRAYDQRDGGLTQMVGDPLLRNIVRDPRYAALAKKMNLPLSGE